MRKLSMAGKWTWASSVKVVTDGVSVPWFVPLSPLVFWSSVPSSMVMTSGQRISAVSHLAEFAREGRRVRQGVHSLSLPVYQHLG